MKIVQVNPLDVMVPEVRVTSQWDTDKFEQFRNTYKTAGQISPILAIMVDNQIILVDGLHRLEESIKNRDKLIDVCIGEGDMVDVLTRNIYLDHLRGKHAPSDMLKVIETLWTEYQMDSDAIASKTGLGRDYIEKLQSITKTTPAIRAALDDEKIKIGHAYSLSKLRNAIQMDTVLQQTLLYHWSVKELGVFVSELLDIAPPTEKASQGSAPPVTIRCYYCGSEHRIEEGKIANPNTCVTCSGVMLESIRLARQEAASAGELPATGLNP